MARISYVNGQYLPHRFATVHIEDRGYQFADGVYEVCAIKNGQICDLVPHLDRLDRSLAAIRLEPGITRAALSAILHETVRRNSIRDGMLYFQITRGVAKRNHPFPGDPAPRPGITVTARPVDYEQIAARARQGVAVRSMPDTRWGRCDIKSISLLPNILAKQDARENSAFEAWLVDDEGYVTEGSSSNAWIVSAAGAIVTHPTGPKILGGITRDRVIEIANSIGIPVEERPFTVAEAQKAPEAFITSTTLLVTPVVKLDGESLGDGKPGAVTGRLRDAFTVAHY